MNLRLPTKLENDRVVLYLLQPTDFKDLYAVASDPEIWLQHPNKNRWKKAVFHTFFAGAIESQGAFKVVDKATGAVAGSTRFYDYNEQENSILIGYTFFAKKYWGTGMNHSVKQLMLDYIFQFVAQVCFHVGAENFRSQVSITRLGIPKVGEEVVTYFGEAPKLNFVYCITKNNWPCNKPQPK